jgi:hypothetical protein
VGNGFNMADPHTCRQEKSLGLLTAKFVSLLQEAPDGILDLKLVNIFCLFISVKLSQKLPVATFSYLIQFMLNFN